MEDLRAIAAELGFEPASRLGADLVRVVGPDVAFAISERHEVFPVEVSTPWHERALLAAFDDLEDARRFLVMEFGALHRQRAALPPLLADQPGPGYVLEEAPSALLLSWLTGSAEFPRGTRERDRAIAFSRVERADVAEIRAAYLEPEGRPLFGAAA